MGGSQKSKRINWASDVNLCQVRLFLSDESPSQVGRGTQDHLQAKTLWSVHSGGMESDDNLPPDFEEIQSPNIWRNKLSQIPLIKWRCPPRFKVDDAWLMVAGEESKELEAQSQREMRVLEAIHPRPSAIPQNPTFVAVDNSFPNGKNTPPIPITSIEDEDTPPVMSSVDSMAPNTVPMISQARLLAPGTSSSQGSAATNPHVGFPATGIEPVILASAQAALNAVMSNGDQKYLIDHNLFIKLLTDSKTIEQLITNQGAASSSQNMASSSLQNMPAVVAPSIPSSSTQNTSPFSLHNPPSTSTPNMPNLRPPDKILCDPVPVVISKGDPPSPCIPDWNTLHLHQADLSIILQVR